MKSKSEKSQGSTVVESLSGQTERGGWAYDPALPRGPSVTLVVDGHTAQAHAGDNLGAWLAVQGRVLLRHSPSRNGARGMFCLMGVCQECLVNVDGRTVTACSEIVREGMVVKLDGDNASCRNVRGRS